MPINPIAILDEEIYTLSTAIDRLVEFPKRAGVDAILAALRGEINKANAEINADLTKVNEAAFDKLG